MNFSAGRGIVAMFVTIAVFADFPERWHVE